MTTNHPLTLDKALKRPGRVDLTVEFKYATENQVRKMFETFLPNQVDKFTEFYRRIKHLKITTAILQHFLFGNRLEDDIMECIPELEKICNENNYEARNDLYI